ncbi:MAG: BMP family protein [Candidatus Thorarchaeota archaeon]
MSSRSNMVISLVIIAIIFGGVGFAIYFAAPYEPSRVAVVMMAPGFGDMSKADNVYEGMDTLAHDVSVQYVYPDPLPTTVAEAQDDLEEYASRANFYDLIIAIGEDMIPALQSVATDFPNQKFAIIGGDVSLDNVASATFESQEAAFLAGVVAAFMADEQRDSIDAPYNAQIGILGAVDDNEINVLINGFIQGVISANETYDLNVTLVDTQYVGYWNNSDVAEGMIYTMFVVDDISVIFAPVRASYEGVRTGMFRADQAFGFSSRQPLVIAAEGNLDWYGAANPEIPIAPSFITTSAYDRMDWAIYDIINQTLWDLFPGGELLEYNLANGGSNITDFLYSSTYIPEELEDALDLYREQISDGTIIVTRDL